jgi:hypothetical protein
VARGECVKARLRKAARTLVATLGQRGAKTRQDLQSRKSRTKILKLLPTQFRDKKMKKMLTNLCLILALGFGIVFNSCEKEKDKGGNGNNPTTENPFVGEWKYTYEDEDPRSVTFTFNADKSFQMFWIWYLPEPNETELTKGTYNFSEAGKTLTITMDSESITFGYAFVGNKLVLKLGGDVVYTLTKL